jgi:RNA polymerase sigma factor for flagellar operon FliA
VRFDMLCTRAVTRGLTKRGQAVYGAAENTMQDSDDFAAHQELVERVVRRLIRELDLSCEEGDLHAWGHQGVLEAKQRFDPQRGVRFSTFAYYRVRGAVLDGVRAQGFIKRRAYAKLKAYQAADALAEHSAESATGSAAPALDDRAREIEDVLGKISAAYVLSALGQSEEREHETPETLTSNAQDRGAVQDSLATLPDKERRLLEAVYFEGATIEEAAALLGLSKSWASRVHAKALSRMKKGLSV